MDNKEEEFQKRIQETFRIEAGEHLHAFSSSLTELEKKQSDQKYSEIIEANFREIHSLKGAARSVDHKEIESICQPLESVFSALKCRKILLSPLSFTLLYKVAEYLTKLALTEGSRQTTTDRLNIRESIQQLKDMAAGKISEYGLKTNKTPEIKSIKTTNETPGNSDRPSDESPVSNDSVRIRVSNLDPLLLQAEEMVQIKIAINERARELTEINNEILEWRGKSDKWRSHRAMASAAGGNEWIEENDLRLNRLETRMAFITNLTERDQHSLNLLVDNHIEAMKHILMLPVSSLVESFPGMVRKITNDQNKEIDFIITGTELEIDKRILEELKDPLIHLIRNSIDHGISKPSERLLQNKPARGSIILAFNARENGQFEITLTDDGIGIDKDNVLKAVRKSGTLTDEALMKVGQKEVLNLIFQSGVSTSPIITDISGHGLGLSIVQEKVIKLNGKVSVESETGKGTAFHILLPLTLAAFRGIVVKVKEFLFIIPAMNVERVMIVNRAEVKTVGNHETIKIDNHILSVADLAELLGLPEDKYTSSDKSMPLPANANQIHIVLLFSSEHRIALKVDEIVEEQQVLVKGLGKLLARVINISGATILGSGKVVPVLNITDLMKSAHRISGRISGGIDEENQIITTGKILVVEDSITSRTMLKSILEANGYQVVTAVDGSDGLTKARNGKFDLVLSDIDMPKMNGFELTAKIRNDKNLNELPVILLTALESPEDREHGIEVGADSYLVKSSFDQGNLLEIIKKLI
jgi:two-component system chemotaxis sensor kinase CheA